MLNTTIFVMTSLSLISGLMLGRLDQMGSAVLQTGRQVIDLCAVLLGNMALWGGLMGIAQKSGLTDRIARFMRPLVRLLFPDAGRDGVLANILSLSMMANFLGLGAAATPLGLKAMKLMKDKSQSDTADNDMATLVILNTASFQLLPTTAAVLRQNAGSAAPMEILLPVWAATAVSLTVALLLCRILQRVM